MFRTYAEAIRHLNRFTDYERMSVPYSPATYDLARMRRLVAALGHPERAFRSLHIAGTKGKGSVAHLTEAILRESGYRTGLYTSPHLVDMLERIRIDGRSATPREFVWAMNRMERPLRRLRPTYFETMTAAAFLLFARRRVDYAVVEVGLGGRLDATNVITPAACAITPIDYDHTEKLGTTIERIAAEKAAIIKPGVPVVTGPQHPAALRVLRARAPVLRPRIKVEPPGDFVLKLTVRTPGGATVRGTLRALGRHQAENAATAIALVEASGASAPASAVRRALARARLPGRIEVVARRPWIVVDTAHNAAAARALAAAIRRRPPRKRLILVFGASGDKDARTMLGTLERRADLVILTRARSPRAAEPSVLASFVGGPAAATNDVGEAVALARRLAAPEDAVVITGSFYVAGEALGVLSNETGTGR